MEAAFAHLCGAAPVAMLVMPYLFHSQVQVRHAAVGIGGQASDGAKVSHLSFSSGPKSMGSIACLLGLL